MADEQLTDKIEAWLKGKLPTAEAAAFQAEVAADPALAEQVELHRLTLRAREHLSEQRLQQNVLAWLEGVDMDVAEEEPEKKPKPHRISYPYRNRFRAAAALLFLVGAFAFYQIWKSGAEKQRIAALEAEIRQRDSLLFELKQRPSADPAKMDSLSIENAQLRLQLQEAGKSTGKQPDPIAYYTKPKDLGGMIRMGEEPLVEQLLKEGDAFFQKNDMMKQAEEKARAALKIDSTNRDALRLLAHALFNQQHFLEAETEFEKLQNAYAQSSAGAKEGEWNRLLCYRALSADAGQRALFIAALGAILNDPDHPYYIQAKRMKTADGKNEK